VKVLHLTALTRQAGMHVVMDNTTCAENEERLAQMVKRLLIAPVAGLMDGDQHLL
jgi:hypothetical protein